MDKAYLHTHIFEYYGKTQNGKKYIYKCRCGAIQYAEYSPFDGNYPIVEFDKTTRFIVGVMLIGKLFCISSIILFCLGYIIGALITFFVGIALSTFPLGLAITDVRGV
jgi:hypothetical protein